MLKTLSARPEALWTPFGDEKARAGGLPRPAETSSSRFRHFWSGTGPFFDVSDTFREKNLQNVSDTFLFQTLFLGGPYHVFRTKGAPLEWPP